MNELSHRWLTPDFLDQQIAYLSDKYLKRAIFVGVNCITCIIGLMIMCYSDNANVRYFGCEL